MKKLPWEKTTWEKGIGECYKTRKAIIFYSESYPANK